MARAIWTGIITFGLVTIPIKLYSAIENKSITFNQLHSKCGTRIKEVRWCPHCDRAVEWDELAKGYQYSKDEYVQVTKEDLQTLPLPSKNVLEVSSFVQLNEIDPIYFERSYYLEPEKTALKPYALLLKTIQQENVVGIAKLALHNKEHLCCIRAFASTLVVETLYYADEIRIDVEEAEPAEKLSKQELDMARHLIGMMSGKFDLAAYKDEYRDALASIIEAKLDGKEVVGKKSKPAEIIDLMEALRASVKHAGSIKKPLKDATGSEAKPRPTVGQKKRSAAKIVSVAQQPTKRSSSKRKPSRKRGAA